MKYLVLASIDLDGHFTGGISIMELKEIDGASIVSQMLIADPAYTKIFIAEDMEDLYHKLY
jgi:hypothetical protein